MKTTGAEWKAYLASWPEGQWFDDSDETINGVSGDDVTVDDVPDNAVVEFSCGVVYATRDDHEGKALPTHFRRWQKSKTTEFMFCEVPKNRVEEFRALVAGIGGKVRSA